MIERTKPLQVAHNVVIGLCRRALQLNRPPTAGEMANWSQGSGREIITLTIEQAQYLLDNPNECWQPSY